MNRFSFSDSAVNPVVAVPWFRRLFMLSQYGFRPFFLLMGGMAVAGMALWLSVLAGGHWPVAAVAAAQWHGHEMLFGFALAAVAGFLLTAVPNWTGVPRVHGIPLVLLAGVWLAGRGVLLPGIGIFAPGAAGGTAALLAAAVDLAFVPALIAALAPSLIRTRNYRNGIFLGLLAGLFVANLLVHAEWQGMLADGARRGFLLAINMLVVMVAVMGGRIIPAFTQNALRAQGQPWEIPVRPRLEWACLLILLAMAGSEAAWPDTPVVGGLAAVAAVLHGVRQWGWRGRQTLAQPILWILHLGALWIPLALALKALALLAGGPFTAIWLHGMTVGVIGTLILGVTTRVALGHTGRPLQVVSGITLAYLLLTAAAVVRVAGPLLSSHLTLVFVVAGGLWSGAFALFLGYYAPVLTAPRVDGKPG